MTWGRKSREKSNDIAVVSEWKRSRGEVTRISISKFRGELRLDIRRWYRDHDGDLQPTKRGESFPVSDLKRLRRAIRKASLR